MCRDSAGAGLVKDNRAAVVVLANLAYPGAAGFGEATLVVDRAAAGRSTIGPELGIVDQAEAGAGLVVQLGAGVEIEAAVVVVSAERGGAKVLQSRAGKVLTVRGGSRSAADRQCARRRDLGNTGATDRATGPAQRAVDRQRSRPGDRAARKVQGSGGGDASSDIDGFAAEVDRTGPGESSAVVEGVCCARQYDCAPASGRDRRRCRPRERSTVVELERTRLHRDSAGAGLAEDDLAAVVVLANLATPVPPVSAKAPWLLIVPAVGEPPLAQISVSLIRLKLASGSLSRVPPELK